MGVKDLYLILYNAACCGGWAAVWLLAVQHVVTNIGSSDIMTIFSSIYAVENLATILTITQTAALMEIVHSAAGLVRSPVMVTTMQVMSRIVAIVAIVYAPTSQVQWGAGLMILSWASVEVPRYAFYMAALITGDATKKTPYPLFWLRYSLFAVLYPTGITGELTVFLKAAHDPDFIEMFTSAAYWYYAWALPITYFFGSPFMIMNMAGNRKSAMKKRNAKPPPPPRGLCWPKDSKGERSSTDTNKAIVAAALGVIDPNQAKAMLDQKGGWRFGYNKYLTALVRDQCTSPEKALESAQAGLDKAYELFEFVAEDGSAVSFKEAMSKKASEQFCTGFVKGEGTKATTEIEVPYKGQILKGQALKDQVKKWVDYGTIEPSAGDAIIQSVDHPEWLNKSLKDRYFVLLGAGSAMGPLLVLMALGANVVAIDLDRPRIWERLIGIARKSTGTMTFPLRKEQKDLKTDEELFANAGCNLFTDTPKIRDWLLDLYPGKPFTVGSYAYLDGALHVQVSLAMDAITRDLSEKRRDTSLAYLCTPTDLHLIPKEAHDAQIANLKEFSSKPFCMFMRMLGPKFLRKNPKPTIPGKGGDFYYVDGISVAQGPNYALAKRMQHWRAIIARSKNCIVSSNVAPSTSTASVVSNRTFAWAYEGMPYFKPFEIFAPETSNAVMSAILLYDLNDPKSAGNPKTVHANPNQLFSYGSFHGGVWRCAYELDSIGEASVLLYFSRLALPYVGVGAAVLAAVIAFVVYNA